MIVLKAFKETHAGVEIRKKNLFGHFFKKAAKGQATLHDSVRLSVAFTDLISIQTWQKEWLCIIKTTVCSVSIKTH